MLLGRVFQGGFCSPPSLPLPQPPTPCSLTCHSHPSHPFLPVAAVLSSNGDWPSVFLLSLRLLQSVPLDCSSRVVTVPSVLPGGAPRGGLCTEVMVDGRVSVPHGLVWRRTAAPLPAPQRSSLRLLSSLRSSVARMRDLSRALPSIRSPWCSAVPEKEGVGSAV